MQLRVMAAVAAAFVFVANTSAEARRYDNQTERSQSEDDDDRPAVHRKRSSENATTHPSRQFSSKRSSRRISNDGGKRGGRHRSVGDRPALEKSKTDQIASYFPHWVSRDGSMPPQILDYLVPGSVIAAHHEWGLSQLERILDYPGKKFKIS